MTITHDDARLIAAGEAYAELGTHLEAMLSVLTAKSQEPEEPPRLALVYIGGEPVPMDAGLVLRWRVE